MGQVPTRNTFAYREVPQSSIGFSPFELPYRRAVRGPMQILKELWAGDCEDEIRNTYQYVLELRNRLEETRQLARESLYGAQGRQKHHYDKKARNQQFKVGQKVLLLLPTDSNKLVLQWKGLIKLILKKTLKFFTQIFSQLTRRGRLVKTE